MRQAARKFLHDVIAELLGIPGKKVIWANQDGVRQAVPLVTLMSYAERGEAMAEQRFTTTPGEIDLRTPTAFVLEVQLFDKKGTFPVDTMSELIRHLERPTIVDRFMSAGVAYLYADPVQDVTALLGNDQQYEPRAAVDLHLRYTSQVIDNPGWIEEVDIDGASASGSGGSSEEPLDIVVDGSSGETPDPGVEPTGSQLIYGTITSDGKVKDLDHAIPVDLDISAKEEE